MLTGFLFRHDPVLKKTGESRGDTGDGNDQKATTTNQVPMNRERKKVGRLNKRTNKFVRSYHSLRTRKKGEREGPLGSGRT